MSLVAKFFVVLNLIVSVAFLVFAANVWTAQTKWQSMYEKEKSKNVEWAANAQKTQLDLSRQVVKEQTNVAGLQQDLTRVKLEKNAIRDDFLRVQSELAKAKNDLDIKDAKSEEYVRDNKRYAEDLVRLRGVLVKQQAAVVVERQNATEARNEKSAMETELNVNKQTLAAVNRDKRQIEEDLAMQTRRIERLLEKGVPVYKLLGEEGGSVAQGAVADAQVLAVRPDVGLIMLSAGSQQNVKPGYQFTISRGSQFIGKAEVVKVYPDMSSARLIPGMMNQAKLEVQVHDEAKGR